MNSKEAYECYINHKGVHINCDCKNCKYDEYNQIKCIECNPRSTMLNDGTCEECPSHCSSCSASDNNINCFP